MLDNNVNKNQQQIAYQAMQTGAPDVNSVPMEAGIQANPELLKEEIQDTYVANRVSQTTEDPKAMLYTAGIAVPAWLAISQGMDVYAKHSRGEYENTVHGKIGKFGDRVSNYISDSSFGKSSFATSIKNGFSSFKDFVKNKIVAKSRILSAFSYTPSKPELDMVKGQAQGGVGFVGFDCHQHNDQFVKPISDIKNLGCYGGTAEDISRYEALLKDVKDPKVRAGIIQKAEFEVLSRNQINNPNLISMSEFEALSGEAKVKLLQDIKAREWGYRDFAHLEEVGKNMSDHLDEVIRAAKKANPKMYALMTGVAGSIKHKFFGRDVYASETLNKMAAFAGNNPKWQAVLKEIGYDTKVAQTGFGRWLTKYSNLVMEGATNRVAGGKLVAIAQAAYLADVIYKSAKAEGGIGEKAKSFAERFAELLSFFICMPLAIQLMHKIGGLQYAGMTPEQVAKYRENLKIHNEKAMKGEFADKKAWKASRDALRKELKAGVKNPITNLFKRAGRIVAVGLEQIRPYDKKDIADIAKDGTKTYRKGIMSKIRDLFRHPKFGIKQMAGYPMRIALGMFILLPFFNKIAVKGSHLIFGKPKHSVLDEGKEEAPKAQPQTQLPPQLQNTTQQTQQVRQVTQTGPVQYNAQGQSQTNLLNQYKNYQAVPQGINNTQTITTTTTTNTVNTENQNNQEPLRTYVPSPVGVVLNGKEDLTAADAAMKRADSAEQLALQTLKMN